MVSGHRWPQKFLAFRLFPLIRIAWAIKYRPETSDLSLNPEFRAFFSSPLKKAWTIVALHWRQRANLTGRLEWWFFSGQYPLSIGIDWKLFSPYCFLLSACDPDFLFFFFKEPFELARVRISGLFAGWILPGLVCVFKYENQMKRFSRTTCAHPRLSSWNFRRSSGSITGLAGFDHLVIEKRCLAWIP